MGMDPLTLAAGLVAAGLIIKALTPDAETVPATETEEQH